MSNPTKVIEVFGKFAVLLERGVTMFDDKRDADEALAAFENKEKFYNRAKAYTDAKAIQGKNAVGKQNIIEDFLAWESVQDMEVPVELRVVPGEVVEHTDVIEDPQDYDEAEASNEGTYDPIADLG